MINLLDVSFYGNRFNGMSGLARDIFFDVIRRIGRHQRPGHPSERACFPPRAYYSKKHGVCENTVSSAYNEIRESRLLEIEQTPKKGPDGRWRPNRFRLAYDLAEAIYDGKRCMDVVVQKVRFAAKAFAVKALAVYQIKLLDSAKSHLSPIQAATETPVLATMAAF